MFRSVFLLISAAVLMTVSAANSQLSGNMKALPVTTLMLASFDDTGWDTLYHEDFSGSYEAFDGQSLGTDGWLVFQLIDGGRIVVDNGYAHLETPDFWNAALIRSTDIMPDEYRIRTKIGHINYDLANYEQADYDSPDFNDHGGYYENGVYFLTLTDDTCSGSQCAEEWWHYHRKMVIDVDNHLNYGGGGETFHPVYMVYMAPETNSGGNLLRTWDGAVWDESAWNWNVAYTYEYDTWYYAELEKADGYIVLRLYDEFGIIIEETTPVSLDKVNAMTESLEYLYVGEPHTDDYEGDVRIDEITLMVPDIGTAVDDDIIDPIPREPIISSRSYPNPFNPATTIAFELTSPYEVSLRIYNILGQKVSTLIDRNMGAGSHRPVWKGRDDDGRLMPAGVYFYRLEIPGFYSIGKIVLLR